MNIRACFRAIAVLLCMQVLAQCARSDQSENALVLNEKGIVSNTQGFPIRQVNSVLRRQRLMH
jgi:hypothetical protein